MLTTVMLTPVSCGTSVVQEGIPDAILTEACYLGWQRSLALVAQFVEVVIKPDRQARVDCAARLSAACVAGASPCMASS